MKLTKEKLLELVQEQLILELFDRAPYNFTKEEPVYRQLSEEEGYYEEDNEWEMVMMYHFISDKDPDNKLRYDVQFKCFSDEQEFKVDFKANKTWKMTNQKDLKIYTTIIAIVKDFAENVRPTLNDPFNKVTNFTAQSAAEFGGDERRARIYKYMLKKIANIEADSPSWNPNQIDWEIPL